MKTTEALRIVLDLATQSVIRDTRNPQLCDELAMQIDAIDEVESLLIGMQI